MENEQNVPTEVIIVFKNNEKAKPLILKLFSEVKVDVVKDSKKRNLKVSKIYPQEETDTAKTSANVLTSITDNFLRMFKK